MKSSEQKRDTEQGMLLPFRRANSASRKASVEFLPAALEILETPASPAGRAIGATIILFFVVAIGWATFSRVDIIATASGKVVPTGKVKVIQPLETGVVSAIDVQDGQHVGLGQLLIQIDRTASAAERARVGHDLMRAQLDVARLATLRQSFEENSALALIVPPPDTPAYEIARTQAAMASQASEQAAKLAALSQQIAQKNAETEEITATIEKLKASLPLVEDLADLRHKAMDIQYGNRVAYLEAQTRLVEQQHELLVQQHHLGGATAARQALERQVEQTKAEYARKILNDLTDAEQKVAELTQDKVKADRKMEEQWLRSPIEGTVQQLAVHTLGGVVTAAQQLMVIVPTDSHLEVEAMVSNRDIGFVHEGMSTEIKIDTFNFTRYGLVHGKVMNVSQDAIVRDKPKDNSGAIPKPSGLSDSSEPQGQELVYATRVGLDSSQMLIEAKLVNLAPGMAVTVEIKTGSRRVIEYILSPLLRYKQESMRER
jgi:membrane fusion protein, hemolysin D